MIWGAWMAQWWELDSQTQRHKWVEFVGPLLSWKFVLIVHFTFVLIVNFSLQSPQLVLQRQND